MSKLSNQTNSQDPQAVNSRVFVGNLNTFQCSKTDVERMFQRYGRLAGISMHKGYAFVQFTNPFDARNACHGEDGRTVLSQVLDVNMVAEPKAHQTGRKRQNTTKTGNDWDYYYDSYYASTLFPQATPQPRAVKRQRLMTPTSTRPGLALATPQAQMVLQPQTQQQQIVAANKLTSAAANSLLQLQQQQQHILLANGNSVVSLCNSIQNQNYGNVGNTVNANGSKTNGNDNNENGNQTTNSTNNQFKIYSNPDILICGNCREMFSELSDLLDHKRSYCKLRFTCKCQDQLPTIINKNLYPSSKLLCVVCKDSFIHPWDLMVHAQAAHMVNIYEIGESDEEDDSANNNSDGNGNKLDKANGESHNNTSNGFNGTTQNDIEMEENDKKNDHSSSSSTNELLLNESSTDNELIINTNGHDIGSMNGKLSADLSPNDLMLSSSSRSTSPSDKENGMDSPPRACIMTTLSINTNTTNPNLANAITLSLSSNSAPMSTQ
ncbi:hypothetical protein PVAND_007029 [Polypedilum vanderplanki]|uniref:RRM domain-containing protein n=1 Tax=Polypedilum vanderplanki TaxID=319348 RepID=A0A9J6C554_POLVA|nr:hypothetical protein PVAND_007029 [Polypedilum vanderplanki]